MIFSIPTKSGLSLPALSVAMVLLLSGCGGYGHIPLASEKSVESSSGTVQVTLRWNDVPGATSYNVYWSKFPGVTRHNSYKIPDAANPIAITDLEPAVTYYFVVTVVGESGESRESREMSFAGMGADGTIDFKDLLDEPPATLAPSAVKPVKSAAGQPTAAAAAQNNEPPPGVPAAKKDVAQFTGKAQATLAWDNVPDAISYNIYWSDQPGVTRQNGKKIANVKNPHALKNLVPGKTYYLVVTAVGKDGESNVSEEISYTVNK